MKYCQPICMLIGWVLIVLDAGSVVATETATDEQVAEAVTAVRQVAAHGQGHDEAVRAMRVLNAASADQIPVILEGMDDTNQLVVNWLRSAVVRIAGDGAALPRAEIRAYFDDRQRADLGRLLAFELLTENDDDLRDQLIPTLIDDPSLPLRYKAIAKLMEESEQAEPQQAIGMLGFALEKARDVDQIIKIAERLDEAGIAIDLQKQLGFINNWLIVGNFDNKDEAGFDVVYGPEKNLEAIDTAASYDDAQEPAAWNPHNTLDPTGLVDLNRVIGKDKGVIAYAYATYDSDAEQTADIRIGSSNAHKVWVNGQPVMSNEIYHNGISPDKFVAQTELKKGENLILVKVCQNEQTQPWAQDWKFQLRVCDQTGKPLSVAKEEEDDSGGS